MKNKPHKSTPTSNHYWASLIAGMEYGNPSFVEKANVTPIHKGGNY